MNSSESNLSLIRFDRSLKLFIHPLSSPHLQPTLQPPRRPLPLDQPLQFTGRPPPIKIPRLRSHLLPINKALPRPHVKTDIPPNRLVGFVRGFVTPYPVFDLHFLFFFIGGGRRWKSDGPICRPTFPLTERRFSCLF